MLNVVRPTTDCEACVISRSLVNSADRVIIDLNDEITAREQHGAVPGGPRAHRRPRSTQHGKRCDALLDSSATSKRCRIDCSLMASVMSDRGAVLARNALHDRDVMMLLGRRRRVDHEEARAKLTLALVRAIALQRALKLSGTIACRYHHRRDADSFLPIAGKRRHSWFRDAFTAPTVSDSRLSRWRATSASVNQTGRNSLRAKRSS